MLNELISLLKDTTLVSVIALGESVLVSREIQAEDVQQLGADPRRGLVPGHHPAPRPAGRQPDQARTRRKVARGAHIEVCTVRRDARADAEAAGSPQALRRARGAQRRRPRGRQRRSRLHPRAQRLGQEHAAALRQPARAARGRRDLPRGPGHLQGPELGHRRGELGARLRPPAGRDGLPAVQPLPPQDGAAERDPGAANRCSASRSAEAEAKATALLERVGLADKLEPVPRTALRRPAAAGRDRPGAGDGTARDALRRGDQRARPRAGQRGARHDARDWPRKG